MQPEQGDRWLWGCDIVSSESRRGARAHTDVGDSVFFIVTTAISAYYIVKFRKDGVMPYESKMQNPHHLGGEAQQKDNAWDTEIEGHEAHDSDDDDRHTERGGNQEEDEYALLHSTETDEGRHPGRPLSWGDDRFGRDPRPPYAAYDDNNNASALSPGGYEEYRGAAPHNTNTSYGGAGQGGQGYSFSGGDR